MKKQFLLVGLFSFCFLAIGAAQMQTNIVLANNISFQNAKAQYHFSLVSANRSEAFGKIERLANVRFVYNEDKIGRIERINIPDGDYTLEEILSLIEVQTGLRFKQVGSMIAVSRSQSASVKAAAMLSISGKVTDSQTGEVIIGASVVIKGTSKGTVTDLDGSYSIEAKEGDVLVFSFVGYSKQEITVGTNATIDVALASSANLDAVTVVGSRFTKPRTDVDRPVPIDVINVKEIQQTGQVDLGQAIHYSAPSFNAMKFGINDAAPFVDPATLRGMGPDQVLVLVNNKRRHKVSFLSINDGVGKGQAGTDVNVVPVLSLKRVEILRDGAAAQYGSDAIAGVINMQLNNASSGGAVTAYYGQGYSKPNLDVKGIKAPKLVQDGTTYNFAANFGLKLGKKGFINTTLSYSHTDGYDRSGSYSNPNATSASTNFYSRNLAVEDSLLKANNINLDRAFLGSAENTTYGIFVNAGMPINDKWDAYAFGGYTFKHVVTGVFTRPPSNARRSNLAIFPNGYNPIAPADLQDYSLTGGVKGKFGNNWDADFSVGQGSNMVDWYAENTVNPSLGATYNGQPAPTEFYVGQTHVTQTLVNADISKTFRANSYPNYSVGAGTEFRYETFQQKAGDKASYEAGPLKSTKDVGSSGREGFSDKTAGEWNRTNIGVYVEGESELTSKFLIGAAARFENYSDFGSDISAKFNTRYKFADVFAIRGSVSRGFRAPSITQSHYSNYVNISFDNAGNSILNPIIPAESTLAQSLGLVDGLKKETSIDIAGGITSKIGEHFTFTADAYRIDVKDRIQLSGQIDVSKIQAFKDAGFTQSANVFVNALDTRTIGLELVGGYNTKIGEHSKLAVNAAFSSMNTDTLEIKETSTGVTTVDNAAAVYITDGQPRNKLIVSANYDYKKFGILFRVSRFGEVIDPLATLTVADPKTGLKYQTFAAKTLLDVSLTYRPIKNLTISAGVNNLTDVYPDLLAIPQTTNEVIFSRRTNQFGTQGRFWNVSVNYNF